MEWIRGGRWEVRGDLAVIDVPLFDGSEPPPDTQSMRFAFAEARREFIAARFFDEPLAWEAEIGGRAGLERYTLKPGDRLDILARYGTVALAPAADSQMDDDDRLRLITLLQEFGPLRPLLGIVGGGRSSVPRGHLYLADYMADITRATWAWDQVQSRTVADRQERRRRVFEAGLEFVEYVRVIPDLTDDGIQYRVHPGALATFLWMGILESLGRWPDGRCRYCGRPFPRAKAPGRPSEYCDQHRGAKFRRLVERGRAPFKELPSIQGDFDDQA